MPRKAHWTGVVGPSPTRDLGPVCFGGVQRHPDALVLEAARRRQSQQRHLVDLQDLILQRIPLQLGWVVLVEGEAVHLDGQQRMAGHPV